MNLPLLLFWALVLLGIQAVSGKAAALWFAVGWLGASLFAFWEAGARKNKAGK